MSCNLLITQKSLIKWKDYLLIIKKAQTSEPIELSDPTVFIFLWDYLEGLKKSTEG